MRHTFFSGILICACMLGAGRAMAATEITKVTPTEAVGIYEAGETVGFTLSHAASAEERIVTFRVSGLDGWVSYERSFTIAENTDTTTVDMGAHPVGWHRVKFYENGTEIASPYCAFSVLRPESTLAQKSPRMAVDYAGTYAGADGLSHYSFSREDKQGYAEAMKKAGIETARERVVGIESESGVYEKIEPQISDLAASGTEVMLSVAEGRAAKESLYLTYCRALSNAEAYAGKIQAWEGANEPDIWGFMPDREAASLKAMAIGLVDSGVSVSKTTCGLCNVNSDFTELLMQNDVMDYLDVINVHSHRPVGGGGDAYYGVPKWIFQNARELATAYGGGKQVWSGETGIYCWSNDAHNLLREDQFAVQARFAVTSMMDSLAKTGVDKNFFFLFRHYVEEHGGMVSDMGCFSNNHLPYPAYNALATLGYYLGEGKLLGKVRDLPSSAEGWMFDNGEKQIAVLWNTKAEKRYVQFRTNGAVRVINVVGENQDQKASPVNGTVNIAFDNSPVIVEFSANPEKAYYTMHAEQAPEISVTSLNDAQKIVLRQDWGDTVSDGESYHLAAGKDYPVQVEVWNLSQKRTNATISLEVSDALEIVGANKQTARRVVSGDYQTLTFTVRIREGYERNGKAYVKFGGTTSDGTISGSVAQCLVQTAKNYRDSVLTDEAFWDWYRPQSGALSGSDGIYFTIEQNGTVSGKIFADIGTEKLQYTSFSGTGSGTVVYRIPWDAFYDSLNGMNNPLELDRVRSIQFVVDSGYDSTKGRVRIGTFCYPTPKENLQPTIKLTGVENLGIRKDNEVITLRAALPEGAKNPCVYVNYQSCDTWKIEDGTVVITMRKPAEGAYHVMVCAEVGFGYVARGDVNFYVREHRDYAAEGAFFEPTEYRYVNG